jgi:uncharacterized protein (DUF111 family)
VRVSLGRVEATATPEGAVVLEFAFQVDDATGEELAFARERLLEAGALDVWTAPVQMKEGRPGVLIGGLVRPAARADVERAAFDHTSTFGLRWSETRRTECAREWIEVDVDGGRVRVKRRRRPHAPDELVRSDLAPEYEDVARLARETGASLRDLSHRAVELAWRAR